MLNKQLVLTGNHGRHNYDQEGKQVLPPSHQGERLFVLRPQRMAAQQRWVLLRKLLNEVRL